MCVWGVKDLLLSTNFTLGPDVVLNTEIHKKFGSRTGSLTHPMHHSEKTKIKLITIMKLEVCSWLIKLSSNVFYHSMKQSTETLINQLALERLHLKFLKRVLGVKLSTSNAGCTENCVGTLYIFQDI